eukprot:365948-Chlamydomonas_euryale.AAC.8
MRPTSTATTANSAAVARASRAKNAARWPPNLCVQAGHVCAASVQGIWVLIHTCDGVERDRNVIEMQPHLVTCDELQNKSIGSPRRQVVEQRLDDRRAGRRQRQPRRKRDCPQRVRGRVPRSQQSSPIDGRRWLAQHGRVPMQRPR